LEVWDGVIGVAEARVGPEFFMKLWSFFRREVLVKEKVDVPVILAEPGG
jgi:hypothetical protein